MSQQSTTSKKTKLDSTTQDLESCKNPLKGRGKLTPRDMKSLLLEQEVMASYQLSQLH
jgi:hypothetical protein